MIRKFKVIENYEQYSKYVNVGEVYELFKVDITGDIWLKVPIYGNYSEFFFEMSKLEEVFDDG